MDIIPSLAFTAVFFVLVFSYSAYRDKKQAEIERLLIEQGKADAVIELRRLRRHRALEVLGGGGQENPWLPVAIGLAAIASAGILYVSGLGDRYNRADVWFVVFGLFAIAWGAAARMAKPRA